VATELARDTPLRALLNSPLGGLLKARMLTPEQGAGPLLHLATVADAGAVNGAYFHRFTREEPAHDTDLAEALWRRSADLTGRG
jgi:hypothetical protein